MNVIGLKCRYVGSARALAHRPLVIAGVMRGALRHPGGGVRLERDDEELEDWPVGADDIVRVRVPGTRETADVRAIDLDVFAHLRPPRRMKLDVQIEEANAQALLWAARAMRRPLDDVLNDAVAAHVRALGVGNLGGRGCPRATTLIGIPPGQ